MKIVHILFSNGISGHEKGILDLISSSNFEISHILYFITNNKNLLKVLESKKLNIKNELIIIKYFNNYQIYQIFFYLYKLIKKLNPFYIHTHMTRADLFLSLLKIFSNLNFVHITTRPYDYSYSIKSILKYRLIYSYICNKSINYQIFISGHIKNIINKYEKIDIDRTDVIHYGVNQINQKNIKNKNYISIGMVGRLLKWKGHLEALKTINIYKSLIHENFKIRIFGNGPQYNQLRKFILKNDINYVEIYQNYTDTEEIFSKINLLLHPSHNEGLGLVILEAFQRKIPCIVSNKGAMKEMVNNKYGYVYDLSSKKDLINGINFCLNNYKNIKNNLKNLPRGFNVSDMLLSYNTFYKRINNERI